MNDLKWQLITECTDLSVSFDPLFDPAHPKIMVLPKLKWLKAGQEDKAQIVNEYSLPALEKLIDPSVQFLRALPNNNIIRELILKEPTAEIIEIISHYTELQTLEFWNI